MMGRVPKMGGIPKIRGLGQGERGSRMKV